MAFMEKTKASCAAIFHTKKSDKSTQSAPSAQTRATDSSPIKSPHPQQQDDDSDRDPFSALSEVSDREPIERTSSGGLPRRSSIEQRMTNMAHSPHTDDGDMFEALTVWNHFVINLPTIYDFTIFKLDTTLCPDAATCATNCAVNGADYELTYVVTTDIDAFSLTFVTRSNIGPCLYLMEDENTYQMFRLLNQEFSFDVDVSNLRYGLYEALYFVSMDADGGLSGMSTAMENDIVLVMSLWDDHYSDMLWLDSEYSTNATVLGLGVDRGTCAKTSGALDTIESSDASYTLAFSNITVGPIGSTYSS
ncbi:uncharacterized protein N7443_006097 [Penicillium atrosanguineum]|uniref:uncharacterized protein n=1 Tax=Penicillium atrosanguineum TaxID=1132637 RepID=UPI0023A23E0F|nr:uncharacterized protein N7443_006097 [Penicillium atrosanguineum]KAJ5301095.1 hypothetical protein N7443_006097 [Penicillium atrosanguineum]